MSNHHPSDSNNHSAQNITFKTQTSMVSADDNLQSLAAARRRLLSSATNNHRNTADDEGKKLKFSVAADPPSHINIERICGGDPPFHANHHTAITADDERVTSSKKTPHEAELTKAKATPKSRSSSSFSSFSSSSSSPPSSSSSSCGYMSSPTLDSDDSDYIPKPRFQIDLYSGDTIIVEHDLFPGTWSCHRLIYGIDAIENKVDLNIPFPSLAQQKSSWWKVEGKT
jgi:hypothetical protein